jgi:hypothetical protein
MISVKGKASIGSLLAVAEGRCRECANLGVFEKGGMSGEILARGMIGGDFLQEATLPGDSDNITGPCRVAGLQGGRGSGLGFSRDFASLCGFAGLLDRDRFRLDPVSSMRINDIKSHRIVDHGIPSVLPWFEEETLDPVWRTTGGMRDDSQVEMGDILAMPFS